MRTLTKTGIRVLTKRYLSVLKKCAILNAMVLMLGTSSAMADVPEVNTWSGLKDAVGNTEVTTINVTGDITYDGTVGTISTISRTLSIIGYDTEIGDTANRILDGKFSNDSQTKGLVVNGDNLTLENITMQNFNGGEVIGGAIENRGTISSITGDFEGNTTNKTGGAISNNGTIESITGDFKYNSATTNGGAVSNSQGKEINFVAENNKNITFDGNYVRIEKTTNKGFGGAIYNSQGTVGLYAKTINDTITFVGGENVIDTERPENSKYDIDGIFNIGTLNINGYVKDSITTKYLGTVNLYNVSDYSTLFGTTNIYGGTVNVKDTFTQMTLMLKGGTLNLGRNANVGNLYITDGAKLSLSIPDGTFENYENEINTLTAGFYSGVLSDLTVDYDATADVGSNMDKITINGAGSGSVAPDSSIKLVRVNVIKDGDTLNNGIFLTGTPAGTLDNIADNTETTSTTTSGGYKYTFTPSAKGVVTVTRTATEETLAQTIQNPTGSSSFSINTTPYTTNENLGSLAGDGRQFTIFGNDNIIEGNSYSGVTVSNGQTFNIVNATMQNFKIEGSGGAIINEGTITSITGDFTQNASSQGGAIFNYSSASYIPKIGDIKGNFVGNHADSTANFVSAGAIYNQNASIKSIAGDFINNYAKGAVGAEGGAIMNKNAETPIEFIKGNFAGNYAESTENYSVNGGAIYNVGSSSVINKLIGNFTNNAAITTGETANAKGGAIYNTGEIIEISESTFTGNMAKTSGNGDTQGGAIYNSGTITIHAKDGKDIKFEGNYVTSDTGKGGAIFNSNSAYLFADEDSAITFVGGADEAGKYDIDGIYNTGTLNINGNGTDTYTGTVILNKVSGNGTTKIYGGNVVAKDTIEQTAVTVQGTLNLGKGGNITYLTANLGSALSLSVPTSVVANYENTIDTLNVGSLMLAWDTEDHPNVQLTVDYDATAAEGSNMDKIIVNNASNSYGKIKLANVNVINDGVATNVATFLKEATSGALGEITDNTTTISTTTSGGYKYTFTPSSKGVVSVTRTEAETLAQTIQNPTGSSAFSINTNPYTTNENLGSLAGDGRNFTIYGNGSTIDGNGHAGITINNGQTFALNNAVMQNFKSTSTGGAIYNEGTISNIEGDFILNTATTTSGKGGAIYNHDGTIKSITGNFKNNSAGFNGGAIYNFKQDDNAKITIISGKFSGNSAQGAGAIYNNGEIDKITGDFENNSATAKNGGAISNESTSARIGYITGNFKGNHADGTNSAGGAIYNGGTIGNSDGTGGITGDFENNSATNWGGAIINTKTINKVTGDFTKNSAKNGGAVYNANLTINFVAENSKNITFSGNYVTDESGNGGAIFNAATGTVGLYASADHSITFTGDTTGLPSTAKNVDSIHNINILNINGDGTITPYTGTVNLYNVTDATTARGTTNIYGGTVNANANIEQDIINVKSGATLASNTAGVEIKADGTNGNLINDGTINITGANSRFGADHLTNNATINITGANSLLETATLTNNGTIDTVSLLSNSLNNNGNITTSGGIEAIIQNNEGGSITFNGDNIKQMRLTNSGTANFNGKLDAENSIIQLVENDGGIMNFSTNAIESTANLPINIFEMNGGLVNIADGNVNTLHIKKLNLAGNTNFAMDADLAAESMDKIKVNNATITDGKVININKINLLSATTEDKVSLDLFADDATKNALINNVNANINGLQYSPTYIYDAKYSTADGKITFTRTEQTNPYLYAPSTMAQATANITGQIAGLAMDKLDVAVTDSEKGLAAGDMPKANNAWVKVMGFDDDVDFKHFNTIDSKAYTLAGGFNTDKVQFADVDAAFGIYGGYIGGRQKYTGNKIDQKGGYIGLSSELAKGNAFLLSTINTGFINNEAENMYGTDKFDTRWLGVGLKGGYNYALTDSWTLQPNIYAGYTLVNTEDYTSKSGVRINNDNLNFFEIDPGFKLTKQIDNGWLGYIQGKYAIVMDNGGKTQFNDIVLPNISAKNYFEYGFGMNKSLTDAWSLNGEINRRDGGRSGWNGSLEFKYNF